VPAVDAQIVSRHSPKESRRRRANRWLRARDIPIQSGKVKNRCVFLTGPSERSGDSVSRGRQAPVRSGLGYQYRQPLGLGLRRQRDIPRQVAAQWVFG
jgi:hypothetical protein